MTPEQALREAINHTRFLADHLEGRMGDGALADMRMKADEWGKALTTPLGEQQRPRQDYTEQHSPPPWNTGRRTPEQAQDELVREAQERGEYDNVLTALSRITHWSEEDYCGTNHARWHDLAIVHGALQSRHLTASAVPYVPEQIRRLPEKWRKVAANTRVMSLLEPADEAAADIYDQCAQELERAIDSAPAVTDGWQPIETAPRDGTFVLVYEGSTTRRIWRAQWDESIGWMFGATSDDHIACALFRVAPTHWMPLPAEPQHGGE